MKELNKEKLTKYNINNINYNLDKKIISKKSYLFKQMCNRRFKQENSIRILDYNGEFISKDYINLFLQFIDGKKLESCDKFRDNFILYIIADYLQCRKISNFFYKSLEEYLKHYSYKALNKTSISHVNCFIIDIIENIELTVMGSLGYIYGTPKNFLIFEKNTDSIEKHFLHDLSQLRKYMKKFNMYEDFLENGKLTKEELNIFNLTQETSINLSYVEKHLNSMKIKISNYVKTTRSIKFISYNDLLSLNSITSYEYIILKDKFPKRKNTLLHMINVDEDLSTLEKTLDEEDYKTFIKIYYLKKFIKMNKE